MGRLNNMAEQKSTEPKAEADEVWKKVSGDDGKADQKEFARYLCSEYGMEEQDAMEAFKKWDFSQDGSITREEFDLVQLRVATSALEGAAEFMITEGATLLKCTIFAYCCCLCTVGLSYLIMYCWTKSATRCIGDKVVQ